MPKGRLEGLSRPQRPAARICSKMVGSLISRPRARSSTFAITAAVLGSSSAKGRKSRPRLLGVDRDDAERASGLLVHDGAAQVDRVVREPAGDEGAAAIE
jgi:hypothetical protein